MSVAQELSGLCWQCILMHIISIVTFAPLQIISCCRLWNKRHRGDISLSVLILYESQQLIFLVDNTTAPVVDLSFCAACLCPATACKNLSGIVCRPLPCHLISITKVAANGLYASNVLVVLLLIHQPKCAQCTPIISAQRWWIQRLSIANADQSILSM